MNFLKSVHSLIFKVLKNSIHSNHSKGVEFFSIFQRSCFKDDPRAFLSCAFFSKFFFVSKPARLVFRVLVLLSVSSAEPQLVIMDIEPTELSLSRRRRRRLCCDVAPKKKARAPSHIWTNEETGVFLSLIQGDETTIGYFNRMKEKRFLQKKMPRMKAEKKIAGLISAKGYGFVAIFHHGYSRRVAGVIR